MYAFSDDVKASLDCVFETLDGVKLFISNRAAATDVALLKEKNIEAILSITNPGDAIAKDKWPPRVQWYALEFVDRPTQSLPLNKTRDWIHTQLVKNKKNTLVHCTQGVSRSPAIVVDFVMYQRGLLFDDALKLVRKGRPVADPNPGFRKALQNRAVKQPLPPDEANFCLDCRICPAMAPAGWCECCKGANVEAVVL
jgi:predicted protein tyrosine phosphatase